MPTTTTLIAILAAAALLILAGLLVDNILAERRDRLARSRAEYGK